MGNLTRFDVAEYAGVSMVIVESDLLPPDPSVIVIPLLPNYPAVRYLNPDIRHKGQSFILATRLIAAVRRSSLRHTGNVSDQGDAITRAVDVLMGGRLTGDIRSSCPHVWPVPKPTVQLNRGSASTSNPSHVCYFKNL